MARRAHQTPLELLIERSVEQALATWLSGQAIRATDELTREVWADEEFRRDFLATARRIAHEALERLSQRGER
jgi:hypothetical protein